MALCARRPTARRWRGDSLVEGSPRLVVVPQEEDVVDGHPRAVQLWEESHEHVVLQLLRSSLLERSGHSREAAGRLGKLRLPMHGSIALAQLVHAALVSASLSEGREA